QAAIAQIGLDLKTRLVDNAVTGQRPARQHVAVVRIEGAADLELPWSLLRLQRPAILTRTRESQQQAVVTLRDQIFRALRLAATGEIGGRRRQHALTVHDAAQAQAGILQNAQLEGDVDALPHDVDLAV